MSQLEKHRRLAPANLRIVPSRPFDVKRRKYRSDTRSQPTSRNLKRKHENKSGNNSVFRKIARLSAVPCRKPTRIYSFPSRYRHEANSGRPKENHKRRQVHVNFGAVTHRYLGF